jgi:S-DNA-T family DNA segregation ATPase FtsK/SpoIIIE
MPATRTTSSSRKPAAKRKPNGAKRMPSSNARSKRGKKKRSGLQIEQRHFDLAGLGLVALAVFLGFVIYSDRDGGEAGARAVQGLEWLLGDMTYAVPPALAAIGAILVLRPVLPAVRPFRAGGICLLLAGALWLGEADGGKVGQLLEGVVGRLVADFGVHVLAIFLSRRGPAATGASVAGVLKATSDSVPTRPRVRTPAPRRRPPAAPRTRPLTQAAVPARGRHDRARRPHQAAVVEPVPGSAVRGSPPPSPSSTCRGSDPAGAGQLPSARSRELEAGEEEEPEAAEVRAGRPARSRSAPRTSPRRAATARTSPRTPTSSGGCRARAAAALERRAAAPDTAGQAQTAKNLVEALGHFGVQSQVIGTVAGPAHHPLRAAPGARHQDEQGLPAQGRPRLRAGRDRHPHPRARCPARPPSASRCPTSAAGSSSSATCSPSRPRTGRR